MLVSLSQCVAPEPPAHHRCVCSEHSDGHISPTAAFWTLLLCGALSLSACAELAYQRGCKCHHSSSGVLELSTSFQSWEQTGAVFGGYWATIALQRNSSKHSCRFTSHVRRCYRLAAVHLKNRITVVLHLIVGHLVQKLKVISQQSHSHLRPRVLESICVK